MPAYGNIPVNVGGSFVPSRPSVNVAGAWQTVREVWVNVAGAWQQAFASLSASISDPAPYGSRTNSATVPTSATTVSALGGVGPFTYAWSRSALASATGCAVSNASAAAVSFTFAGVASSDTGTATWTCTVTDTTTGATASVNCFPSGTNMSTA